MTEAVTEKKSLHDRVAEVFLDARDEESFVSLFKIFSPQLVAFFRARGCRCEAEDLAQEVMITVHRESARIRDRSLFRGWLFTIARHTLYRHRTRHARHPKAVNLAAIPEHLISTNSVFGGTPTFEFFRWMAFLDFREREALILRFVEEREYREIAAAQDVPIGTAQWRVFSAKRKLAPHLRSAQDIAPKIA